MLMIRNGGLVIKDVWGYEVWLKLSFGNIKIKFLGSVSPSSRLELYSQRQPPDLLSSRPELGCAPRTVDRKLKIVLVITFEP